MNILIITGIFPPDAGGPATYVPMLAEALASRGHDITVVTTSDSVASHGEGSCRVIRVRRALPLPLRVLAFIAAAVRAGRRADVVFANGMYPESVAVSLLLRRPLVVKVVGDWAWERAQNKRWTAETFAAFQHSAHRGRVMALCHMRSYCVRRAAAVIVPSRFLGGVVERWGVERSRIRVIHNAPVSPAAKVDVDVPLATRFRLIAVGRLVSWKRVDQLVEALASWPDSIGLIVVGDGPEKPHLVALARRLGVEDRIWFAGARSRAEVASLLARSTILVLNSTYEGLPHVVLEAMHAGVPVVATDAGGTGEAIDNGRTGVLVSPDDSPALGRAVLELLADPERLQELAARARTFVRTAFDGEITIRETEITLRSATNREVPPGRPPRGM